MKVLPVKSSIKTSLFMMALICSAGFILFGAVQAQAKDMHCGMHQGMHYFKWWQSPELSKDLRLTTGEKQSLDNLFVKNRNTLIDLKSSFMKDRYKLHDMLEKDTVNETSALAQNKVIEEDKLKISNERIKYMLGMRKILGPDRFHRLMAKFHEMRGKRHSPQGKEFRHEPKEQ
ncbi:MAG: Spy/CpxP family protein refolding chaperone [Desulfomonilia bacterium]